MKTGADFSDCRTWRYGLWRTWDEAKPCIAFIGLNPSTADEKQDDPTIRRCIRFARDWGFGTYLMLNLFAYRATDPRVMKAAADPIGPKNDQHIVDIVRICPMTIAAWGVHGTFRNRDAHVYELLAKEGLLAARLYCLGLTKDLHPRHPLYLRADCKPIPFVKA